VDNGSARCSFVDVAIKKPGVKSKRRSIKNIIMQGTVWGSFLCTATMDKLGQLVYKNPELTYKYKGVVETPSLGMVDVQHRQLK
jgi:hypothetical protein